MDLSVVIPALNEAGNIGELVKRARFELDQLGIQYEIIVVDGGSKDNTATEATEAGAEVLKQIGPGYGGALRTGFGRATGAVIITMDSDLSHEPEFLKELWNARAQSDMLIASRYVRGGKADMSAFRYVLSRILNFVFRIALWIPVNDMSSGFRLYHHAALNAIEIKAINFDVLEEILIKIYARKHKVVEVPFHYKPRQAGESHARLAQFAIAYLKTLARMIKLRVTGK